MKQQLEVKQEKEIPEGWEKSDLGNDFKIVKGRSSKFYQWGNVQYLTPDYLRGNTKPETIKVFVGCVYAKDGETILLWDGSNAGEVFKAREGILASTMVKFDLSKSKILPLFFFYKLKSLEENIKAETRGSGIPHVDHSTLSRLKFISPSESKEQEKIASILQEIDKSIEKTQNLIVKHTNIKEGLVQDLFRSKNNWKVCSLKEIGSFKNGVNKGKDDFGFGTKFVNILDAYPEKLPNRRLDRINVNYSEIRIYRLELGDIILVRSSVKPSGVGYNTLFEGDKEEVVYCGFTIRYRLHDKNEFNPLFYNYYFRSEKFRKELIAFSTVSANTNINQECLKKLKVYKPSPEEQKRIADILTSADKKIESEQNNLDKLIKIKRGLMQDLLTGKVRVKV